MRSQRVDVDFIGFIASFICIHDTFHYVLFGIEFDYTEYYLEFINNYKAINLFCRIIINILELLSALFKD